jgi:hypothetical protein
MLVVPNVPQLTYSNIVQLPPGGNCLKQADVEAYMNFVFQRDVLAGNWVPVTFSSWADVYNWTSMESMARRKHGVPDGCESESALLQRMMYWHINDKTQQL